MGYRVAPRAFVVNSPIYAVYGPGRHCFDGGDWWVRGNTLPDDPDAPAGHVEIIGRDGLHVALDRVAR